ncbi:MAG: hypothetical protein IPN85_04535 [Flavobacteriales bacterium]|nr:hypothetical protein [Flavobacteriales bacterium]MBK9287561.1 hypothetical protein [Flavobacteriales bacterium]MBL0037277.1 hypothetical protein [Flavobacteriales bacterium]
MTQLELLQSIDFHDQPVSGLRFELGDMKEPSFVIDFETYDDEAKDFVEWSLQLNDLISFSSTRIEIASDSDFDFFSFHLAMDGTFKGDILLTSGFGKLNVSINLECRSFVLANRVAKTTR